MGYCGWLKQNKCRHRTKNGGCSHIHYGCPYGPRDSKPTEENCVETIKAGGITGYRWLELDSAVNWDGSKWVREEVDAR